MLMQKIVQIQGPGDVQLVNEFPILDLHNGYIKIKSISFAVNPSNWRHIDYL